jgi:hypothetical protein
VSILIGVGAGAGRYIGSQPRSKTSMTIIRPPQWGQGQGRTRGSSGAAAFCSSCSTTGGGSTEQLACACDVSGTLAAGEQTVMANAVEAFGQNMG